MLSRLLHLICEVFLMHLRKRMMSTDNWLKKIFFLILCPYCFLGFGVLLVSLFVLLISLSIRISSGNQRGIWNSELQCFLKMSTSVDWKGPFSAHTYKSTTNVLSYACKDTQRLLKSITYLTPMVSTHGTLLGVWHLLDAQTPSQNCF